MEARSGLALELEEGSQVLEDSKHLLRILLDEGNSLVRISRQGAGCALEQQIRLHSRLYFGQPSERNNKNPRKLGGFSCLLVTHSPRHQRHSLEVGYCCHQEVTYVFEFRGAQGKDKENKAGLIQLIKKTRPPS